MTDTIKMQLPQIPYDVVISAAELGAPAIHIKNDVGDWAKIEHDGTFTCSNPDAITELAELFWNHLATLGPLFEATTESLETARENALQEAANACCHPTNAHDGGESSICRGRVLALSAKP